jgi:hypothetical protein
LNVANTRACPDTGIANCEVSADGSAFNPRARSRPTSTPQSDNEFIIGAEHQFGDHIRIGASFTHRELTNVIEDMSIDLAARKYCIGLGMSVASCTSTFSGGNQFVIANPGKDVTVQLNKLPDGSTPVVTLKAADLGYPMPSRTYNALTLTFDRSFDQKWSLSASYTLSFNRGNYEGGVRSENGQLSINRSADFDSPGFVNGALAICPATAATASRPMAAIACCPSSIWAPMPSCSRRRIIAASALCRSASMPMPTPITAMALLSGPVDPARHRLHG